MPKVEEEPPAKLLDDLFRKTKATPCIYWLPLTDEQVNLLLSSQRWHLLIMHMIKYVKKYLNKE